MCSVLSSYITIARKQQTICDNTLPIFRIRRDAVVASAHRLPVFSTSARRDVLRSATGRLLLPFLDSWNSLPADVRSASSLTLFRQKLKTHFISAILPRHCFLTASPTHTRYRLHNVIHYKTVIWAIAHYVLLQRNNLPL